MIADDGMMNYDTKKISWWNDELRHEKDFMVIANEGIGCK